MVVFFRATVRFEKIKDGTLERNEEETSEEN